MAIVEPVPTQEGARRRLKLRSPGTLEDLGELEVRDEASVRAVIARARAAQPAWDALGVEGRAHYVHKALQRLLAEPEELARVIQRETGKSRVETMITEIFTACDVLHYFAKNAKDLLRDERVRPHLLKHKKVTISYRPYGVVGIITPWNSPFLLSLNPTVQALLAGNTVVLKPSEATPLSGGLVERIFHAAGLPADVLTVVQGDGETGAALVQGGVNKVSFTGSVPTGRKIGEACGRNLVPFTLELGGKDPMIICADADLDAAAKSCVLGAMVNAGQVCCSTERVYVVKSVAEEFTRKVVERVKALRQGASGLYDIGPIIWPPQVDIIERQVEDARAKGATVLTGGRRNRALGELFFEPTVLTGVTHDMLVMKEETFGPVLPICVVADEDEAVRLANDSAFGLSSSLWTRDAAKGQRLSRRIESGSVCINDFSMTYGCLEAPYGGIKASGVGRVNGPSGIKDYCYAKPILSNRFPMSQDQGNFPFTEDKASGLLKAMRWLFGTPLGRRLM